MTRPSTGRAKESKTLGLSGLTYAGAVEIQTTLRRRLVLEPRRGRVSVVAGADVAFTAGYERTIAGFVAFSWPKLEVIDVAVATVETTFPYVPGLLSFREIPALVAAWRRLSARPEVVFVDGQGVAHPRRFGLASHLGVLLDVATIGCAKSVLVGEFDEPGPARGARSWMTDAGERVGAALRTRDNVKPMYISPGHMMNFATAARMVLAAGRGYRLPEPTRAAHALVTAAKRRKRLVFTTETQRHREGQRRRSVGTTDFTRRGGEHGLTPIGHD
jgi:deoxyribonuclease V